MDANTAIRAMLGISQVSPYRASLAIGRAHSYVDATLRRDGKLISAAVLADIGHACGYDLVLVPHDPSRASIDIDGTTRAHLDHTND